MKASNWSCAQKQFMYLSNTQFKKKGNGIWSGIASVARSTRRTAKLARRYAGWTAAAWKPTPPSFLQVALLYLI
jgi:hypothetical protein